MYHKQPCDQYLNKCTYESESASGNQVPSWNTWYTLILSYIPHQPSDADAGCHHDLGGSCLSGNSCSKGKSGLYGYRPSKIAADEGGSTPCDFSFSAEYGVFEGKEGLDARRFARMPDTSPEIIATVIPQRIGQGDRKGEGMPLKLKSSLF
ncbi:hypothetical protein NA57DRAFT_57028 [Rhizodiscina lignyota]|uniref:Uncharacterized protein n=1 Tax=Rhizodiscina lignyota TaxID=1504668 RepID=A0A9P4IA76_9PEZI|nr:hypothetical protein NA57DRAFT_57028 [Rhizodiscina lignyota]